MTTLGKLGSGIFVPVLLAVAGCSTLFGPKGLPVDEGPAVDAEPALTIVDETPIEEIRVTSLDRKPLPKPLPSVAIVLTNQQPAYADVARELTAHFKRYDLYDLSDASRAPVSVLRSINDSNSAAVVAIGLRAARSAVAMSDKPVVFSQVFNYRDAGLLTENSRGVAALPPLAAQLAAWKKIDPTIARVGMILGEGHDDLVQEAELAAERYDVELRLQITHSDQETLYFFRRMIRDIDGFWLFPDNRILSARVLRQMLGDAKRQQVPVSVPSESMLQHGAMVSMAATSSDIAARIVAVVKQIQAGDLANVPPITPLTEIRVKTTDTVQVVER